MPASASPSSQDRRTHILGLPRHAWWSVAIAFAIGLLLFFLIWMKQRNDNDFFRGDGTTRSVTGEQFEPLPGPDLGATGGNPDLSTQQNTQQNQPADTAHVIETRPPAPPTAPQPSPTAPSVAPPQTAVSSGPDAAPVPISRPAPVFPRDALRRGESGEVLLRVNVGIDGLPDDVEVVRGSGSRSLDRAAAEAVKKWRFRPARRAGQPVPGSVQVPIAFNLKG